MNWYKKAQQNAPIQFLGWSTYHSDESGEMAIAFKGKRYVYYDISREESNYIKSLLGHKNYSTVAKTLISYKKRWDKKQLTSRGHTPQEEEGMLNELEERGFIN